MKKIFAVLTFAVMASGCSLVAENEPYKVTNDLDITRDYKFQPEAYKEIITKRGEKMFQYSVKETQGSSLYRADYQIEIIPSSPTFKTIVLTPDTYSPTGFVTVKGEKYPTIRYYTRTGSHIIPIKKDGAPLGRVYNVVRSTGQLIPAIGKWTVSPQNAKLTIPKTVTETNYTVYFLGVRGGAVEVVRKSDKGAEDYRRMFIEQGVADALDFKLDSIEVLGDALRFKVIPGSGEYRWHERGYY